MDIIVELSKLDSDEEKRELLIKYFEDRGINVTVGENLNKRNENKNEISNSINYDSKMLIVKDYRS